MPRTFLHSRADLDWFKADVTIQMNDQPDLSQATPADIDVALDTWMTAIKTKADRHIKNDNLQTNTYLPKTAQTDPTGPYIVHSY